VCCLPSVVLFVIGMTLRCADRAVVNTVLAICCSALFHRVRVQTSVRLDMLFHHDHNFEQLFSTFLAAFIAASILTWSTSKIARSQVQDASGPGAVACSLSRPGFLTSQVVWLSALRATCYYTAGEPCSWAPCQPLLSASGFSLFHSLLCKPRHSTIFVESWVRACFVAWKSPAAQNRAYTPRVVERDRPRPSSDTDLHLIPGLIGGVASAIAAASLAPVDCGF